MRVQKAFDNTSMTRSNNAELDRVTAAILEKFAAGNTGTLTALLLDANTRQFPVILRALSGSRADVTQELTRRIRGSPDPGATREEKFASTRRQANAALSATITNTAADAAATPNTWRRK